MKLCLICNFQTAGDQDICPRDGSSMVTVGDDPLLGMVVEGRYKIQSVIGQGSAGTVYRAVQELIGREVAVKVLHDYLVSDDEFIKRFKQEAKASSRLNHPNIITIYDFGVIPQGGGRPYIAMDLLNGIPLSDVISEINHLSVEDSIPVFTQVCAALGEAHRQGVVHRDIKPENIVLVERGGQKNFPIVVDFGIARLVQEESDQAKITRTGTVCGSPTYMSPEQCTSSKVDHRSDIYSFGIVMYETLTGEVPFQHEELVRVMAMQLSDAPKPIDEMRPDLPFPPDLVALVNKTLSKSPADRYQTMDELIEALEKISLEPEKPTPTVQREAMRDTIIPGPLAQDDTLHPRKESRDMLGARPNTREMTGGGLGYEAMSTTGPQEAVPPQPVRTQASNYAEQVQAYREAQRHAEHSSQPGVTFSAGRTGSGDGGMARKALVALPIVASLILLGAVIMFATNAGNVQGLLSGKPADSTKSATKEDEEDVDQLIKAGKFSKALTLLKQDKQEGTLSEEEIGQYELCCLSVAKQHMKDKKFNDAISLLKEVSSKSTYSKQAKDLLKKAKRGQSK
ncbi:MAG: serine/threonine protein kinase [Candidatus Obscuribacter phosphatis]|uniref:non-specific serine/threonine protein kinase n=1 Tax=Candidatus Obscuribacter phosphatis TaxID=1906157 RepID=A0A8J7PG80_9BACT|nr:serine/threonine protein kinase [Candidatus Obscuribacter phosphatis]